MSRGAGTLVKLPYWIKSTLGTKLSIALTAIVILTCTTILVISHYWMQRYHEETTQRLNASIAMYINDEYQFISQDKKEINLKAIEKLSRQAMIINPMAEAYLLDQNGKIIAHSQDNDQVVLGEIGLSPIKAFIAGAVEYPIYAQDPKSAQEERVFSATELKIDGQLQGYLFVILGGSTFKTITAQSLSSYSTSMLISSITLIALVAVISSLIIFKMLLSRLKKLSSEICRFTDEHSDAKGNCDKLKNHAQDVDEIQLLDNTFKAMSEEIRRQFKMLKQSDEARRELISNVSHDLRTPIASLQGYLETMLIKSENLSEQERQHYLCVAMNSSKRLNDLVTELFELSKLESPTTLLNTETFSLTELVYDTLQDFSLELDEKGIVWKISCPETNVVVSADISLIQRVFENLIRNAIAYTPVNGEIKIEVVGDTFSQSSPVTVRVSDTGVGINQEDLPHIFDRFYSSPDRSREGTNSTGLGLAIVKRILDMHNSNITVESQLNLGTKFEFELPTAA